MDATFALTLIEAVLILLAIAISKAVRLVSSVDDSCKDAVDSIPADSIAPPAIKGGVFLSFRGEDTRDTFSSHLYEALCDAQIQTFMDHKLHKGDHIQRILSKKIKESEISLIIFSKDYASSTWCMDELVHIMKCKDHGRLVIPIFYNVDPSNIRKQNGSFGDGFAKLKQRFKHNQEKVQEWENALIKSTSLSGWNSKNVRPESKLVKEIVKDILSKLKLKPSIHLEGLVGIAHQIRKIEELLSEARIVGIWGMGGIGKTTLASAVFERLKGAFEAFYFVKDVREKLAMSRLDELLETCLKELLKDEDINTYDLRSDFVRRRLHRKKVILVLDDVENFIAAEDLVEACGWFGEGSRIIITSRDMQVLKNASVFSPYHVPTMDHHHALHLFSLKAFKQNQPFKNYLELSERAVYYCHGNPLALRVLGCLLLDRGKEIWESALEKLNQTLDRNIFDVLKLSYDGLDDMQKNKFLDLAFLLKEGRRISPDCAGGLYGSYPNIDIDVLKERSLISMDRYDKIEMHPLLMEMGLEISQQQLKSNPENPIRLWKHGDIYHYFSNNDKGIEAIRCMSLDESKIDSVTMTANHFRKMRYLMYLNVYKSDTRKPSNLTIYEDLDYLSKELRFLMWDGYPRSQVPLRFCVENLITLKMPNSNIRQFGDGDQQFPNLKKVWLQNSKHLSAPLDLFQAPNIEYMSLHGSVNLGQIHSSTVPEKNVNLFLEDCGPMQINVGGNMKGTSSLWLVIVHNYLDVVDLSLHKVTIKFFVCGKIMCGVRFKHVRVPLGEMAEMRMGIQSLGALLPFVRKVDYSESPIEFGDAFKQHHHTYYVDHHYNDDSSFNDFSLGVRVCGDRGEKGVVGKLMEDEEEEDDDNSNGDQVEMTTLLLMEDDDDDDSESDTLLLTTTLLPNSIPRWSLLRRLTLKESDTNMIGENADCNSIPQVSIIFKSLDTLSCTRRIQPLLALQLSSSTLSLLPHHQSFNVFYRSGAMPYEFRFSPSGLWFYCWQLV